MAYIAGVTVSLSKKIQRSIIRKFVEKVGDARATGLTTNDVLSVVLSQGTVRLPAVSLRIGEVFTVTLFLDGSIYSYTVAWAEDLYRELSLWAVQECAAADARAQEREQAASGRSGPLRKKDSMPFFTADNGEKKPETPPPPEPVATKATPVPAPTLAVPVPVVNVCSSKSPPREPLPRRLMSNDLDTLEQAIAELKEKIATSENSRQNFASSDPIAFMRQDLAAAMARLARLNPEHK